MAGIIKPTADLAASAAGNGSLMRSKPVSTLGLVLAAPAGMPPTATAVGTASSRQGSLNSGCFYDAESCYEACCNRQSFLLPEDDLEETPYCTGSGAGCSQTPLLLSQSPLPGAASKSAAAAAPPASVTPHQLGLTGAAASLSAPFAVPAAGVARSPLLSASTVAALMMEDESSFDLLQLQLAPASHQLMDEEDSEQFMSLCGGPTGVAEARTAAAAAADAAGMLFDAPLANGATAATAAMAGDTGSATSSDIVVGMGGSSMESDGRRGLLASHTALTAVRRGGGQQADFGVSGSSGSDQDQPVYRLVLLDGLPGSGTAPGCVSPTSQRLGSSPSTILEQAARMGTVAAARAVCDDTFSGVNLAAGVAGEPPRAGRPRGVGQRQAATVGGALAKGRSAGSSSTLYGAGGVGGGCPLQAAEMSDFDLGMISGTADFVDPAELAATTPPAAAAAAAAAALAAMVAADSGSGGDSSNEGAPGLQQDDSSSNKGPAAAAAVPLVKPKREFHHKGGGPCDHCGVLESPQWRRGPPAKPILCNACGTRYRRTHNLGPPIPSSGRPGGRHPHTSSSNAAATAGTSSSTAGSSSSSSGGAANRKRPATTAAAAVAAPTAPGLSGGGGVHLGTRSGSGAISGRRPVLKLSRY